MERTDPLTGLLNQPAILELLEREAERVRRGGPGFALAMAELDGFARVHESHGAEVASQALVDVARLLHRTVRAQDAIARWSGEKLLVFLPATSVDGGVLAADKVRRAVADRPRKVGKLEVALTVSVGVAAVDPGQELPTCVQRAEAALFHAKAAGGNRVSYSGGDTSLAEIRSAAPSLLSGS
jgi:diguanylate cyclase (GGDEF)-like protein